VTDAPLQRTPLHSLHTELGGRLVDFAGWELPVQYEGVIAEHTWCRTAAALFDVSHMGVVELHGPDRATALEALVPAAIEELGSGRMRYTMLTTDDGGILDDLMVTNAGDHLVLVVNAARRDVDVAHLRQGLTGQVEVVPRPDVALLAVQGPRAVEVLATHDPSLADLVFLDAAPATVAGVTVAASRSGYTGEDGFELVVPAAEAEAVARALLAHDAVRPAGLGARDTLRLEAGLCLYGHDLDESTTPVEADLAWSIQKWRRAEGGFPGAGVILGQLADGPPRRRVGLRPEGRRPVRDGALLLDADGFQAGVVTSGGFGPTVGHPVAMGYVPLARAPAGTTLVADVRGSEVPVTVSPLPFTPHRYRRGRS
jgi:aminomethyltransferase